MKRLKNHIIYYIILLLLSLLLLLIITVFVTPVTREVFGKILVLALGSSLGLYLATMVMIDTRC